MRKWIRPAVIVFAVALTASACANDHDQPTTVVGGARDPAPQVAVTTPTTFAVTPATQPASETSPVLESGNAPPAQATHQM
jgi:hypothetical protein